MAEHKSAGDGKKGTQGLSNCSRSGAAYEEPPNPFSSFHGKKYKASKDLSGLANVV